jgi:acetolactate synthase regulatory subunit
VKWRLVIQAVHTPRIESRVLQIADHLLLEIDNFSSHKLLDQISISVTFSGGKREAERLASLVERLYGVLSVTPTRLD